MSLNSSQYEEVRPTNWFYTKNNQTYFGRGKFEQNEKEKIFVEAVLKIVGYVECENANMSWVLSCRAIDKNMELRTKLVNLSFCAFQSLAKFTSELQTSFGNGLVINGAISRADLTDFLLYLKDQYLADGEAKAYKIAKAVGYMGNDYWFLSSTFQIKDKLKLQDMEIKYFDTKNMLRNMELSLEPSLFNRQNSISINQRIIGLTKSFGVNSEAAVSAIAFTASRLLSLTRVNVDTGETNILLLYGEEKNVGKTLTQHMLHFGQGATCLVHDLLISGGNSITNGTSSLSTLDICRKTTMLVNINDIVNSQNQAETMLQIHEKLQQGSSKRGLFSAVCSGIIMSSNFKEPSRLDGRVLRLTYVKGETSKYEEEQLKTLKLVSKEYHGFLLSWVLHFKDVWLQNWDKTHADVVDVLTKHLPEKQQRWCGGMALLAYTKFLYLKSLDVDSSLAEDIEKTINSNMGKERVALESLEQNIFAKLQNCSNSCKVKLTNGTQVQAVAVKSSVLTQEFTDVSKESLTKKTKVVNPDVSIYFAKDGVNATKEQQRKRDANIVESKKGYKIPLSLLKNLEDWIKKDDLNAELIRENTEKSEDKFVLPPDDVLDLEIIERTISESLLENNTATVTAKDDLLDDELMTPSTRAKLETLSPKKRRMFHEGMKFSKRRLLTMEDSEKVEGGDDDEVAEKENEDKENNEDDGKRKPFHNQRSIFTNGAFGAFPCASNVPSTNKPQQYCSCKETKEDEMINCSGSKCPGNNWFHVKCIKMKRKPKRNEKWYCTSCNVENVGH